MSISTDKNVYPTELNKAHGRTVDTEGLLNNYAIEPEVYIDEGNSLSELINRVTVIDIFESEGDARGSVSEMEQKGLLISHISIVAKDYQEPQSSLNWENISACGGLPAVLTKLGISDQAIARFVEATDNGKFLVIEMGNDRQASQMQHVLAKAGHTFQAN
ncbi:hypothetical protein H6F42_17150 [Pseudanabaena sp. FACHB-1998]|uniref:hypothetical protein n=1 Tax=Pseudanabaena sp. FACHB-1998 TaxID=2692858 RepID=UPI001681A7E8|nr:hypothetical protein [Pseudanabaena sp. FACHB-1998]MBD2178648.1 hypothetical protein [Pseudanabaena sp. FACHB-1998]